MTLPLGVLEPCVQRVVDDEPAREQLVIIGEELRQAQGNGEQSSRLRGQVQTIGVRPADDNRQLVQGRIRQGVLLQKGVEAAQGPIMRKLDSLYVVWGRAKFLGTREHQSRRGEEKLRRGVNESGNQPWAGDAIDLRTLTRNPSHRRLAAGWHGSRSTITSVSSIVRAV